MRAMIGSLMIVGLTFSAVRAAEQPLRFIDPDYSTGTSQSVVVDDVPLAHTAQFLPVDADGKLVGNGDVGGQINQVLANLQTALSTVEAGIDDLVKLNVYVADAAVARKVEKHLSERFTERAGPAVAFVETELPLSEAAVAMDAVAVAPNRNAETLRLMTRRGTSTRVAGAELAVMPAGERLYVSGQAERADGLAEATQKTMESLEATLAHLGAGWSDVVQLKAFFLPMSEAAVVRKEMASFFPEGAVPPIVFVEWESTTPIEIELVAQGRGSESPAPLEFITPPGMKPSPIFSRVARMRRGPTLYVSGLFGNLAEADDASEEQAVEQEVREIFTELGRLLEQGGSDFDHLVKATYYVSTDATSRKLNEIRPEFYNPQRAPAASKALVRGVGREGRGITLDMIAAVKR